MSTFLINVQRFGPSDSTRQRLFFGIPLLDDLVCDVVGFELAQVLIGLLMLPRVDLLAGFHIQSFPSSCCYCSGVCL